MKSFFISFMSFVLLTSVALLPPEMSFAQGVVKDQEQELTGPRKQLATIIFTGLAGAVLGLSTLSFYGRPQDNLKNIALGFAIGVIGGTGYVTYQATMHPEEFYGGELGQYDSTRLGLESYQLAQNKTFGPIYFQWDF